MFEKMTILGPGLLGASLAMVAHKKNLASRIDVWARRREAADNCKSQNWCNEAHVEISKAVADSQFVVICTPVRHIERIVSTISSDTAEGCLVTDVGSVKQKICTKASEKFKNSNSIFIGSHPMAGSDKTGMDHAHVSLFEGRPCFITPDNDQDENNIKKLVSFWKELGMQVSTASPVEHDAIVAHLSHLPHAIAMVICNLLAKSPPKWNQMSGQGLRDTTRIAAGDPAMWEEIFSQNRTALLHAAKGFEKEFKEWIKILEEGNTSEILNQLSNGKVFRDSLK